MFNLKVPKIYLEKVKRLKVLGKGKNIIVYLIEYGNKLLSLKIQPNYSDAPDFIFIIKKLFVQRLNSMI